MYACMYMHLYKWIHTYTTYICHCGNVCCLFSITISSSRVSMTISHLLHRLVDSDGLHARLKMNFTGDNTHTYTYIHTHNHLLFTLICVHHWCQCWTELTVHWQLQQIIIIVLSSLLWSLMTIIHNPHTFILCKYCYMIPPHDLFRGCHDNNCINIISICCDWLVMMDGWIEIQNQLLTYVSLSCILVTEQYIRPMYVNSCTH